VADYLYDGSFEGLLTCVYDHYYVEKADDIYKKDEYQASMLKGFRETKTDTEKADIVYTAIAAKISAYDLKRVYKVFMSAESDKENRILNYLRLGFRIGGSVSMLYGHPAVYDVLTVEKRVNNEIHRLKGLIRFSELTGGVLYSDIEPDHDIVEFLSDHFCDRYKNEPFIIHDVRRNKALVAYRGEWYVTFFTQEDVPSLSDEETNYRKLWKQYFDNMAIKQRINPGCQKNMMPVRYWKHLTEMR